VQKWGQEHLKAAKSAKRRKIEPRLLLQISKVTDALSIATKINDFGRPWRAETSETL